MQDEWRYMNTKNQNEIKEEIIAMTYGHAMWDRTIEFAEKCSWRAGTYLAEKMRTDQFEENERVLAALIDGEIAGYCTFSNYDEIPPEHGLTPFVGFMFVDENFRGHRLSEKLIDAACDVARSQGYSRIYLMTGEIGLYEKYGFEKQGNLKTLYDTEDQLFSKELKPKKKVVVVPYDETWKQSFIDIRNELADALGELAESIEHVGSTSVEGLSAKPIIDIDVVIKDRTMLDKVIEALEKIGYRHEGDQGIPGREAFKYEDKDHLMKHHLYVCAEDANELKRHMAFRDYLRSHPEAVKEYSRVKTEGAKLYPEDIDSYIEYKAPFIEGIYKVIGF